MELGGGGGGRKCVELGSAGRSDVLFVVGIYNQTKEVLRQVNSSLVRSLAWVLFKLVTDRCEGDVTFGWCP